MVTRLSPKKYPDQFTWDDLKEIHFFDILREQDINSKKFSAVTQSTIEDFKDDKTKAIADAIKIVTELILEEIITDVKYIKAIKEKIEELEDRINDLEGLNEHR